VTIKQPGGQVNEVKDMFNSAVEFFKRAVAEQVLADPFWDGDGLGGTNGIRLKICPSMGL